MDKPKVPNGSSPQLGIFFTLRRLHKFSRVASEKKRLHDFPPKIGRCFCLIQLLELANAMDQAKLANGFAAEGFIFLTLCGSKQAFAVASQHVGTKNGASHGNIGICGIDFRHDLVGLCSTEKSQVLDRLALQFRIALPLGNSSDDLASLPRPALRQNEQRARLFPRRRSEE